MRRLLTLTTLTALALAQGQQTTETFYVKGACGPGYVQRDFLDGLLLRLGQEFGESHAETLVANLRAAAIDSARAIDLMNGRLTDAELKQLFGLQHEKPQFVRKALEEAVADKDRRLLFGALMRTAVEKGVDPSSEFCQFGRSRDEITDDQFDRLCRGETSASLMRDCFRLRQRDDQRAMQGYVAATRMSPYLLHPLGASLALRAKRSSKRGGAEAYDPSKFPTVRDEMPGYGDDFNDGKAGGLPFDKTLPPVPYYGKNLEDFFAAK
jgi:hypothetical protein